MATKVSDAQLQNTGIAAGTYNGVTYNAQGVAVATPGVAVNTSAAFISPVSGYQALLMVAPGYQIAVGSGLYVGGPLLTDKTSGDATTGYKGGVVAGGKPTTIALQTGNSMASGLTVALPIYEGTGTSVHDISGNGLVASFVGAPTWGTGPNGTILTCSSSSIGLALADTPVLDPSAGLTISARINTSATQTNGRMVRKISTAGVYLGIVGSSAASSMSTTGTSYSPNYSAQLGTTYENAYHLYTYTVNTSTNLMSFYIDGTLIGTPASGSGTLTWDTSTQQIMGGANNDGSAGILDVYYEWNRALSAAEVASLASSPYQLIGVVAGSSNVTALMDAGAYGYLPINTVKITRAWAAQLTEVLEYSTNGTTWTAIPTGYAPVSNGGTSVSLQTTVTLGAMIAPRYLRYSGKDTGAGAAVLLTDLTVV
jgi:hypothetical protein